MSSPAQSILEQCVAQSKSQIDLTGVGTAPGIADENVRAVRVPYQRDDRQRFAPFTKPSLLYSVAQSVEVPAAAGNNNDYVAFYTVLAQIIHTEMGQEVTDISKSIMQWEYNIRNYFHMGNLRQSADSANTWYVTLAPVQKVDLTDEKLFHIYDDAAAVIPIVFKSVESHSTTGRT